MGNYCTPDMVKTYLYGIDTSALTKIQGGASIDYFINAYLPITKRDIDRYLRQSIDQQTITDFRANGSGTIDLMLPNWPIVSVTKCVINYGWASPLYTFLSIHHASSRLLGLPSDPADVGADLLVDRDKGIIRINPSSLKLVSMQGNLSPLWNWIFTEGDQNIQVDYTYGFTNIPEDIQAAQAMLTAILIGEAAAGRPSQGASAVKIGTVSRTWANRNYASLFGTWEALIQAILDNYQVREASY